MEKEHKQTLIKIGVSAAITAVAYFFPTEGALRLATFAVPYLIISYDVLFEAIKNIFSGRIFDEELLMSIATIGAFGVGEYPEAVAVMLFYKVGEMFEDMAVDKSKKSISALMDIRPDKAVVVRSGKEETVSPEDVKIGEIILIKPGEKIPLDGEIISGETMVNTAALTGESLPQEKQAGEKVISGSINLSGVIEVMTESTFGESTVSKILSLVENASDKKAKAENFITKFSRYYTPCVVVGAVLLAIIPSLITGEWAEWINRALIFLMVSCPCALVVSVPLSFFGGIGGASKNGILIKGANYLETLSKVDMVVFDKTGTLTRGNFSVNAIHASIISADELLDIAAAAESYSTHPVAESIVAAHNGHIDKERIGGITELSGMGLEAIIDHEKYFVGNAKLMAKAGANYHDCHLSGTVIHISHEEQYLGHIVINDEIKADSKSAIDALKGIGISKTVMLTGDTEKVANAVGKEIGIDEIHAGLFPADKVEVVEALINEGKKLAFVGDGINDAPVLTRADIGISMGALGSEAAIEAADVVLMDDKPSKIPVAVAISRKTMKIVRENIVFALLIKFIILVLGAIGLANMWIAVIGDVGVMILATFNALRAMKTKKPKFL